MRKILVTGGAGFIGSHLAEHYARCGDSVTVLDNLSRAKMVKASEYDFLYNWDYLKRYENIRLMKGDVRVREQVEEAVAGAEVIFHTASQTAVTTSVVDPEIDFTSNVIGTFNILEAARCTGRNPTIVFCSTNKVYGDNVNQVKVIAGETRYHFEDSYAQGIPEIFPVDLCKHTPYGCSKLSGDLYMQDYACLYGLKIGVFRMSCIYGPRQFGVEDQGWVAWFTIAALLGFPITIYGDGRQVRDVLYVSDLVRLFDTFVESDIPYGVYNAGGGPENTLSLLELLGTLRKLTGKQSTVTFDQWRPSDQKVYISNINKAKIELGWNPSIDTEAGIENLVNWISGHLELFTG